MAIFEQPSFLLNQPELGRPCPVPGKFSFFSTFLWTAARFPHTLCVNASLNFPERNSSRLFQKRIFFWYTIK
jgi:hypothetical protein